MADNKLANKEVKLPDQILDPSDPGDDTGARFRYQYCYAALLAIQIISEDCDIAEVICENHEDVLLKRSSGRFIAVQVKTRRFDQPPFKATDNAITKSLKRFVQLNAAFPEQFELFEFVTNFQFWESSENDSNICWLLENLKNRGGVKGLRKTAPVRAWVQSLSSETGEDLNLVVNTLLNTNLVAREDTLKALSSDLQDAISVLHSFEHLPNKACIEAARGLVQKSTEASTLKMEGNILDLYEPGANLKEVISKHVLEGKKLTESKVQAVLNSSIQKVSNIEPTKYAGLLAPEEVPKDLGIMVKKLTAGDLEGQRIDQLKTSKKSLEHLYLQWVGRYGSHKATEMYENVMSHVQFECTEAQVEAAQKSVSYAPLMYSILSERLKTKRKNDSEQIHRCSELHLMGAAAILTQECKAWWSDKFDVDGVRDEEA